MLRGTLDWLEDRTGIPGLIKHFLYEDIPDSSGWHQVFGSVAVFAFLTQVFTGIMLSLNYAPTPGEAYDSLRYIVTQVTAGRLMRGLHHWGASLMIIVVVLHMIQTFLWGTYKKPREATWIAGILLLLMTLAFGLSGYLLPWDNRSYWATVVTTHISSLAPGAGPYVLTLLGADGTSISVVTFARFYAAHVMLLPLVTFLLIGLHVYLVRKHGVAPSPDDEGKPKKKFYPEQVGRDTVAIFIWFVILMGMAVLARVPLGHIADPTDLNQNPRPEWYFLFLFQFVKLFDGPLEVIGAVVIPTLAIVALILLPFVDRAKMTQVRRRVGAIAVVIFAALAWGGLTARAISTTPDSKETDYALVQPWQEVSAGNLASIAYIRQANCASCHALGKPGPASDLTQTPSTRSAEFLKAHIKQPVTDAPANKLTDAEVQMVADFVVKRSDKAVDALIDAPQTAVDGAVLFIFNDCGSCHKLNGAGDELGPNLNGLGERRTKQWVEDHFADPPKYTPGSVMPPFSFSPADMELITNYIMAIPK